MDHLRREEEQARRERLLQGLLAGTVHDARPQACFPTALHLVTGNQGKRPFNQHEAEAQGDGTRLPGSSLAQRQRRSGSAWEQTLHQLGVTSELDRPAFAAYCQAYGRWVEAERKLRETPALLRTPVGYVQPSPWLATAKKNLELMAQVHDRTRPVAGITEPGFGAATDAQNPWEVDEDDEFFS